MHWYHIACNYGNFQSIDKPDNPKRTKHNLRICVHISSDKCEETFVTRCRHERSNHEGCVNTAAIIYLNMLKLFPTNNSTVKVSRSTTLLSMSVCQQNLIVM